MNVGGMGPERPEREALLSVFTDLGVSEESAQACIDDNANLWGAILSEGSVLRRYVDSGDSSLLCACFEVETPEEVDALLAERPLMDRLMDESGSEALGRLMIQKMMPRSLAEVDRGQVAGVQVSAAATVRPVVASMPQGGEVEQPVDLSRRAVLAGLTFLCAAGAGLGLNALLNSGRRGESSEAVVEDPKQAAYVKLRVKNPEGEKGLSFERETMDGRIPASLRKQKILDREYIALTLKGSDDTYVVEPDFAKGLVEGDSLPFRRVLRVRYNAKSNTFDPVEFAGKKVNVSANLKQGVLTVSVDGFKFVCPVSFDRLNTKKSGNVPVIFDGDIE